MNTARAARARWRRGLPAIGAVALAALPIGGIAQDTAPERVAVPQPRDARGTAPGPSVPPVGRPANVDALIEKLVPPRSDSPADWQAPPLFLHARGEPRTLAPCVPPAPCHPAYPPRPLDLLGVAGAPTCGPRYGGPCAPRLGSRDDGPWPRLHALHDAAFDAFYR